MRSFISSKNYSEGTTILTCTPFAAILLTPSLGQFCSCCFVHLTERKRCSGCKKLYYCSALCQKSDWTLHKEECKLFSGSEKVPVPTVRLILRCVMKTSKSIINTAVFEDLCCNLDQLRDDEKIKYAQLIEPLRFFVGSNKFQSCFDGAAKCLEVINRVAVNTITIVTEEFKPIGYGIYPEASLVNHSCEPNAVFVFRNQKLLMRTLRPIAINEEVVVSYTDQLVLKEERRKILKQQFNFTCQCSECKNLVREKLFHAVKTDTRSYANERTNLLPEVGFPASPDLVQPNCNEADLVMLLQEVKNLRDEECFEKLEKFKTKFLDLNLIMHELLVKCANMASQNSFKVALPFELRLLANFEKFYAHYHPMKSLQYTRVAKIFSFLGEVRSSVAYFEKALRNIAITHGSESELYKGSMEQFILDQREMAHYEEQCLRKGTVTQK